MPLIGRADWNDCLNLNCFSTTPGESFQTTTNKDGKIAESGSHQELVAREGGVYRNMVETEEVPIRATVAEVVR